MRWRRFPQSVYGDGKEPDPRFSLANERTFLAWLRTAMAMYAGAFALAALALPVGTGWRLAAGGILLALGTLASVQSWIGWAQTERALRAGRPLPGFGIGGVIIVGVIVAVALVTIGTLA